MSILRTTEKGFLFSKKTVFLSGNTNGWGCNIQIHLNASYPYKYIYYSPSPIFSLNIPDIPLSVLRLTNESETYSLKIKWFPSIYFKNDSDSEYFTCPDGRIAQVFVNTFLYGQPLYGVPSIFYYEKISDGTTRITGNFYPFLVEGYYDNLFYDLQILKSGLDLTSVSSIGAITLCCLETKNKIA